MDKFAKSEGAVYPDEHVAFLLCWLSRDIFCTPTLLVSSEFLNIAYMLSHGLDVGLGRIVLAVLYRSLTDAHTSFSNAHLDPFFASLWMVHVTF